MLKEYDLYDIIMGLEREIGFKSWNKENPLTVLCVWTRLLAILVDKHIIPYEKAVKFRDWAGEISTAPDDKMLQVCDEIHNAILKTDSCKASDVLKAVCASFICSLRPLSLDHKIRTRWPAEASAQVWSFVTGSYNLNEVTTYSRMSWQRHLYSQALALAKYQR